jgi:hypothetical protein
MATTDIVETDEVRSDGGAVAAGHTPGVSGTRHLLTPYRRPAGTDQVPERVGPGQRVAVEGCW